MSADGCKRGVTNRQGSYMAGLIPLCAQTEVVDQDVGVCGDAGYSTGHMASDTSDE